MFDNLDEQIKQYDRATVSPRESLLKWSISGLVSVLVVVGIFLVA